MTLSWARRVVPSWDLARSNARRFVTAGATPKPTISQLTLTEKASITKAISEFETHPTLGLASEVLRFSAIVDAGDSRLDGAAEYVLKQTDEIPKALHQTAIAVVEKTRAILPTIDAEPFTEENGQGSIRRLRAWLRTYNRDALAWSDLARSLAANANNEGARRAITTALSLHPNSRLILRNAARFHLHNRDPERALNLLQRHARTRVDPWLMAGHIAISSIIGKESRLLKLGRQLIEAKKLSAADVTELASSIATVELQSGSNRTAKKLFNISLESPNQNSLAQVEWASKQLRSIPDLPPQWFEGLDSAEAGYYRSIIDGDFATALVRSLDWARYEPFASRPLIAASFLSSMSGRHDHAIEYAKRGLTSEPRDSTLLNNLLFASANDSTAQHDLLPIIRQIWSLQRDDPDSQTLANLGMIAYLSGDFEKGEKLYENAWARAKRSNQLEVATNSLCFHAYYAQQSGAPKASAIQAKASSAVTTTASSLSTAIFEHLFEQKVDPTEKPVSLRAPLPTWEYDASSNTLRLGERVPVR